MTIEEMLKTAEFDNPAVHAAKTGQLHLAALGLAKTAGVQASEFDMATALNTLGRKLYMKKASWRMVAQGLEALKGLSDE